MKEEARVLSYNEILKFINNIYYAKGKTFNADFMPMWSREILATNASIAELQKAEIKIIRDNVPLVVKDVCEAIVSCKEVVALPPKQKCDYCHGKGYVLGILFDHNKVYTGYEFALNCVCGNACLTNVKIMKEDTSNNHKTPCKDGYYRIFPSIVEKFAYLDKVEKNNWRDIR